MKAMIEGMSECCVSLFLADGKIGARLVATFKDEAMAKEALKFYETEVWSESERNSLAEGLARAREKNDKEDIEMYDLVIEIMNGCRTAVNGNVFSFDLGRIDMRRFFSFAAKPVAELLEML